KKLGDPLENLLHNWMHLINESMRNVARAEAFDFGSQYGIVEEVPKNEMNSYRSVRDKNNNTLTFVHPKTGENVLMFQKGGKPVYFKVFDAPLFNALGNMNNHQLNNFLFRLMGKAKRTLTYGATFGPAFRVRNAIRDTVQAGLLHKSFKPFIDTAKGTIKAWRESPEYIAFMASGYGFGGRYIQEGRPEQAAKHIKRILKTEGKGAVDRILSTPSKLLEFWDKIGAVSEAAARVQLYSNLLEKGESHLDAAFEGRDLLDFTLHGASKEVQILAQITPFLNARIQGLSKVFRAAAKKDNRTNFIIRGTVLTAASMALWALNKDDDRYKELEDWDRFNYYHFWIGNLHYRIPKPFEVGALFSSLPETLLDVLYKNEETKHIADFLGFTAVNTFSLDVPQLFRPLIEQWANKSFFTGRPIVGERLQGLIPSEQKEPWTSETMQLIGKALKVSPKRAEHIVRGYFSTFGAFILGGTDIVAQIAADFPEQPTKRIDDYPLIGGFVRQAQPARYTKKQSWFYDTYKEMDELVKTSNHYKAIGNIKEARELATKNKEQLRLRKLFNRSKTRISKINRKIRKILLSDITSEEKANQSDKLIQERNDIIDNVYKKYKEKTK
ncbi:MAG: hypothetical protein PVI43_06535, partial [Candidatus Bathyarchaeota archaeon]